MIKIAICDNEPVMCEKLRKMISKKMEAWGEEYGITCFVSGIKLLFSSLDFDLLFLDIQMPGIDGVNLARRLREKEFEGVLIFVTILKECMLDAFEVEAMDYLCKPVDEKRLENALKRSLKRLGRKQERRLFIQTINWCRTVKLCDIYYCEVINRKIFLHTKEGIIDYYGKIKDVQLQTAPFFIRCHRSYLINPDYLVEYMGGQVRMANGEEVPVSKNYRQTLMEKMMDYMEEEYL